MTLTQQLSKKAIQTPADAIPDTAFDAARRMVLDTLGCALAGWNAPGIEKTVSRVRQWAGTPEASVLVYGDTLPTPNAALANGAMIHALDYDDVYIPGSLHIMSVILPTTLAVAEHAEASGRQLLAATIMGVEIAARLSIEYKQRADRPHVHHLLPTSICGGFGAVAAAARLYEMSADQCAHAMGINYAQASGNRQALHDMTLTKRLQPGFAARSALWSVALAGDGLTGPAGAIDGRGGLFRLYLGAEPPAAQQLMQNRELWEIERDSVKPYPSCGACHPTQAAAERLRREEQLRPDDIDTVKIFGPGPGGLVGNQFQIGDHPQVDAQFSVRYAAAYALLRGELQLQAFTNDAVRQDTQVAQLAKNIEFVKVPDDVPPPMDVDDDIPPYAGRWHGVVVATCDGRRLIRWQCPAQTFHPDKYNEAQVEAKVRGCAEFSGLCDKACTDELIASVQSLNSGKAAASTLAPWYRLL